MNRMNPIIRKPTKGRTIAVVGDIYRFLATGDDTNGKYALWEAIVLPGGGPPPHVHSREEEGFYILEGEITFTVGDKRVVATAGTRSRSGCRASDYPEGGRVKCKPRKRRCWPENCTTRSTRNLSGPGNGPGICART